MSRAARNTECGERHVRGTEDDVEFVLVAARDIAAGEELTQNYTDFDEGPKM